MTSLSGNLLSGLASGGGSSDITTTITGQVWFQGDYSGLTDQTAAFTAFINANPGLKIMTKNNYSGGRAKLLFSSAINPNGGQSLNIDFQKTILIYSNTDSLIYTSLQKDWQKNNTVQYTVNSITTGVVPDGYSQTTDVGQVHILNVTANSVDETKIKYEKWLHTTSSDQHPVSSEHIRMGATMKVAYVDNAGGKIYLDKKFPFDPATYFTTSVTTSLIMDDYDCEITGGIIQIDSWNDDTITTPSGRHIHALDIIGYPYAYIHHVKSNGTYEGFISVDMCPEFLVENNIGRKGPNMKTQSGFTGGFNSGHLGYGVAFGPACDRGVIRNNKFSEFRHMVTSVHHSVTSYDVTDYYQSGLQNDILIKDNVGYNCYGVGLDLHEGANRCRFIGNIVNGATRGPQGGSYVGGIGQDRGSNTLWMDNYGIDGQNGIRVPTQERLAGSIHRFVNSRISRMYSSSDALPTVANSSLAGGSTRNQAVYIDNHYGITNVPKIDIDGLITDDTNSSLVAFGGAVKIDMRGFVARRGGVPIELFAGTELLCHDKAVFDFRGTTRTPTAFACVRMLAIDDSLRPATPAKAIFLDGAEILKDTSANPSSFFLDEGASAGTGLTLTFTTTNTGGVYSINTPTIAAGGTGYAVNDLVQVAGTGVKATVRVATLSGSAVATLSAMSSTWVGAYTVDPAGTGVATSAITATKTYWLPECFEFNVGAVTKTTLFASGSSARFAKAATVNSITGTDLTSYDNGTVSTGTLTPDSSYGQIQSYTNGGAHTLAPPATETVITLLVTNNGSAGAITTSGFTKVTGDSLTTTNASKFMLDARKVGSTTQLNITAMQ